MDKEINEILKNIENTISTHPVPKPDESAISLISLYCEQLYPYTTYVGEKADNIKILAEKYYSNKKHSGKPEEVKALILSHINTIKSFLEGNI